MQSTDGGAGEYLVSIREILDIIFSFLLGPQIDLNSIDFLSIIKINKQFRFKINQATYYYYYSYLFKDIFKGCCDTLIFSKFRIHLCFCCYYSLNYLIINIMIM